MLTILLFIVVLSLLVFVHELGHFLMAKKNGMRVDEFGFGFPPRIWGVKKGDTLYSVNWIPLGGFVKIKGESGEHKTDSDSFASKSFSARFGVLVAGVAMNFLLAVILFSIGFMIGMPSVVDENTPLYARVSNSELVAMEIVDGSPASAAGIVAGTRVLSIDSRVFDSALQAREYVSSHANEQMSFEVRSKDDSVSSHTLSGQQLDEVGVFGVGIAFVQTARVSFPPHIAVIQGVSITAQFTYEILRAFGGLLKNLLFNGQIGVELSGPVGIAVITGEVAALGFIYLLQFVAVLSINLGIINVLPFPALDGGRILFLIIEKIRGRAVNEHVETAVHNAGFVLLMILVILVTYRDVVQFGDEILGAVKQIL